MTELRKDSAFEVVGELTRRTSAPAAVDVIVIGAGQAGLAIGHRLARSGVRFVILEARGAAGDGWRRRYDGLTLFTPRGMSALPGLALDGEPDGYATRDEFGEYLETYATHFNLPVHLNHQVKALERNGEDAFIARCSNGRQFKAPSVVVATGPFQVPQIPAIADEAREIEHHAAETFRCDTLAGGSRVLVVGDGASGRDIAAGLSSSHDVFLAIGKPRRLLPDRIFGRSTWWWLGAFGLLSAPRTSIVGRVMVRSDPFPNRGNALRDLANKGVSIRSRLIGFENSLAQFGDGSTENVDVVIWATGYRDDYSWIRFEMNEGGDVQPVPGLFFIGRPWQFGRRSSLIVGAEPDSSIVAKKILERHHQLVEGRPVLGQQGPLHREVS